jgi:hypothetical protein
MLHTRQWRGDWWLTPAAADRQTLPLRNGTRVSIFFTKSAWVIFARRTHLLYLADKHEYPKKGMILVFEERTQSPTAR